MLSANNPYGNVVLITGASSGIGRSTAIMLAKNGFRVYGASRRGGENEDYQNGFIHMIKMDVCSDASVAEAVSSVISIEGSIDILINAAGIGVSGAVEECSAADAFTQFNTNYFGIIRTIGAVLPHMRKQGKGLIINIGSVGGIFTIPFQTLYSSSKFALEALTEGLRIELAPFNVKATLIEPGDIKTGFTKARMFGYKTENSAYGDKFHAAIAQMEYDEQNGKPPETIAKAILKVINKKNPPVRTVVGGMYKAFVFLKRIMPDRFVEFVLTQMYPNSKKKRVRDA
ncbi:MAG TPA: SDR family oxidoreductase [Clostridiales bacterium]|jgi:short-subunit dehydrogenase|nr:SDR family oxidoreductase [Clostridiales bacterium]